MTSAKPTSKSFLIVCIEWEGISYTITIAAHEIRSIQAELGDGSTIYLTWHDLPAEVKSELIGHL